MFGQTYKSTTSTEDTSLEDLKAQYKAASEKEVKAADHIVNLRMFTGCGCGGARTAIFAVVPDDQFEEFSNSFSERDDISDDDVSSWSGAGIAFYKGSVNPDYDYDLNYYVRI